MSVDDFRPAPIGWQWTRDGSSGLIAAANNRIKIAGPRLHNRGIHTRANRGDNPSALTIHDLDPGGPRRQQPSHDPTVMISSHPDRPVVVATIKRLTAIISDVRRDDEPAVISAHDPVALWKSDQNCRHHEIVTAARDQEAGEARQRPAARVAREQAALIQ